MDAVLSRTCLTYRIAQDPSGPTGSQRVWIQYYYQHQYHLCLLYLPFGPFGSRLGFESLPGITFDALRTYGTGITFRSLITSGCPSSPWMPCSPPELGSPISPLSPFGFGPLGTIGSAPPGQQVPLGRVLSVPAPAVPDQPYLGTCSAFWILGSLGSNKLLVLGLCYQHLRLSSQSPGSPSAPAGLLSPLGFGITHRSHRARTVVQHQEVGGTSKTYIALVAHQVAYLPLGLEVQQVQEQYYLLPSHR